MKLQMKMNLIFSILILVMGIGLCYSMYTSSIELISESMGIKVKNIAKNVASEINTDELHKVTKNTLDIYNQGGDADDIIAMHEYQKIREKLWEYKRMYNIKFLYIMTKTEKDEMIYIVDGFPLDYNESNFSKPGDIELNTYELLELAYKEEKAYIGELTYDQKWGANLASYVPMFDSKGSMIGVLGIDIEAGDIYNLMEKWKKRIVLFTLLAVIVTIAVSLMTIQLLTKRLKSLISKVKKVQEGDFSVKFDIKTKDEFGELGAAFDDMVSVFNENNTSLNKTLIEYSKIHKVQELDQKIIDSFARIVPLKTIEILEFDVKKCISGFEDIISFSNKKLNISTEYIKTLKIGEVVENGQTYLVLIGNAENKYRILMIDTKDMNLNKREILTISLLSRYISIFYENLFMIGELSDKIINLQNEGSAPSWMSKLFLQISEKERKRLASDLHDEVLQNIIKIKKSVSNLCCSTTLSEDEIMGQLKKMDIELGEAIRLVRETCNELLPSFLMEKGITGAVNGLIERTRLKCDINISFEAFNITTELEYDEILTVYRVVQELINNAITHAKATEIDIMLRQNDDSFVIYYYDNGVGMDLNVEIDINSHFGISGIKERIKLLDGSVSFYSNIGEGFELSCQFPIKNRIAC